MRSDEAVEATEVEVIIVMQIEEESEHTTYALMFSGAAAERGCGRS